MTNRRGSVIVESALTLTLVLFVLYGALEFGLVGLDQMTLDGGAYTAARQQSFQGGIHPWASAWSVARSALPHLDWGAQAGIFALSSSGSIAPPPMTFNSQYGFNTPNARYGGVTLIQPVQTVVSIVRSPISDIVLGSAGYLSGMKATSIQPQYRLINPHFDVAGNNFNTAGAASTNADPLSESAPPYFVGYNYLQTCTYQIHANQVPWTACPVLTPPTALGSAEYLDVRNWSRPVNGVFPSQQAVFWETRYHQTLYARISTALKQAGAASADGKNMAARLAILDPINGPINGQNDVWCVYEFDNNYTGAYAVGNTGAGDPLFALHPDYTDATCVAP